MGFFMEDYIIRETDDFLSLSTLFHESGMGVKIEERMPDRIIKMWRMDDALTGKLIAAVTFVICMTGLVLGKTVGTKLAGRATIFGGFILIAIGVEIFVKGVFL